MTKRNPPIPNHAALERHEWPWYPVIKGDFFNLPRDHQTESITLYGRQKIRQLIAFRCKPDICHTNIAISHCHIVNTSLRFADLVVEKKHSPNGGMKWCFGEFHPVERIKKIAFPKNPSTPQIWVILRTKKQRTLIVHPSRVLPWGFLGFSKKSTSWWFQLFETY